MFQPAAYFLPYTFIKWKCDTNADCPMFVGKVGKRLHIGLDDPANSTDINEVRRVRDEVKNKISEFYLTQVLKKELPKYSCSGNC